jgi:hypothetical protein
MATIIKSNTFQGSLKNIKGLFPKAIIFRPISSTKQAMINLSINTIKSLYLDAISGYVSIPISIAENVISENI